MITNNNKIKSKFKKKMMITKINIYKIHKIINSNYKIFKNKKKNKNIKKKLNNKKAKIVLYKI